MLQKDTERKVRKKKLVREAICDHKTWNSIKSKRNKAGKAVADI
jgi:hypothetical protein